MIMQDYNKSENYINRELSWLDFNLRVLHEARDKENPLFERLKFLAITSSNLDEFFMVRVASLKNMEISDYKKKDASGLTPHEQLEKISEKTHNMVDMQYSTYEKLLLPQLAVENISILNRNQLSEEQKEFIEKYFKNEIYPVLTPMAVDSSRPFPLIQNKVLNICALIKKENKEQAFATVQIPSVFKRIVKLPSENGKKQFILLEEIVQEFLPMLFMGYDVLCYRDRVFTTEVVSYPEMVHVGEDKDFTPVIEKALELGGYSEDHKMTGINGGEFVTTGFAHNTVLSVADKVIDGVKQGKISHFFLVGGCDGAKVGRNYYTDFVKQTPKDSIILTLACGKYRFNDLDLGDIDGLPRIMDMGQCNDAYSAIKVAIALAEAFECDVNELPLSMVLSWYEQKAVCILLTLLHLGIKDIFLGPTLPAFISPNVLKILVDNYNISPISTPEEDLKRILG